MESMRASWLIVIQVLLLLLLPSRSSAQMAQGCSLVCSNVTWVRSSRIPGDTRSYDGTPYEAVQSILYDIHGAIYDGVPADNVDTTGWPEVVPLDNTLSLLESAPLVTATAYCTERLSVDAHRFATDVAYRNDQVLRMLRCTNAEFAQNPAAYAPYQVLDSSDITMNRAHELDPIMQTPNYDWLNWESMQGGNYYGIYPGGDLYTDAFKNYFCNGGDIALTPCWNGDATSLQYRMPYPHTGYPRDTEQLMLVSYDDTPMDNMNMTSRIGTASVDCFVYSRYKLYQYDRIHEITPAVFDNRFVGYDLYSYNDLQDAIRTCGTLRFVPVLLKAPDGFAIPLQFDVGSQNVLIGYQYDADKTGTRNVTVQVAYTVDNVTYVQVYNETTGNYTTEEVHTNITQYRNETQQETYTYTEKEWFNTTVGLSYSLYTTIPKYRIAFQVVSVAPEVHTPPAPTERQVNIILDGSLELNPLDASGMAVERPFDVGLGARTQVNLQCSPPTSIYCILSFNAPMYLNVDRFTASHVLFQASSSVVKGTSLVMMMHSSTMQLLYDVQGNVPSPLLRGLTFGGARFDCRSMLANPAAAVASELVNCVPFATRQTYTDASAVTVWGDVTMDATTFYATYGPGNLPQLTPGSLLTVTGCTFNLAASNVLQASGMAGYLITGNTAQQAITLSNAASLIALSNSDCSRGCVLQGNAVTGQIDPSSVDANPTTATYGTSALYSLTNVSIANYSAAYAGDNGYEGLPFGMLVSSMPRVACDNKALRALHASNPSATGFIADACCDMGLPTELCCSLYCPPPRPTPPPYCVVDQYTDVYADDYLYVYFRSVFEAIQYCRAGPVKTIYLAKQRFTGDDNGRIGLTFSRVQPVPMLALSKNDTTQHTMVLMPAPDSLGVRADPQQTQPVLVGYNYRFTSDFELNIVQGVRFEFDPSNVQPGAGQSDVEAMLTGGVNHLVMSGCTVVAVPKYGTADRVALTPAPGSNVPQMGIGAGFVFSGSLTLLGNNLYGSRAVALDLQDATPSNNATQVQLNAARLRYIYANATGAGSVASQFGINLATPVSARIGAALPSPQLLLSVEQTEGRFHLGQFINVARALQANLVGNTCKVYCGGMHSGTQYMLHVAFRSVSAADAPSPLFLVLENNALQVSDAQVQSAYGNPVTGFTGGMLAAFQVNDANQAVQQAFPAPPPPQSVAKWSIKNNVAAGYPVAFRLQNVYDVIENLNEPPGADIAVYDFKRPLRELQVLNNMLLTGTQYDIKNGSIQNDVLAGNSNACNGMCIPGSGLYCEVSRDYTASNTVGYGRVRFGSVQQAIDGCIYVDASSNTVSIKIWASSNTANLGPGGMTVFYESVRFQRASDGASLVVEGYTVGTNAVPQIALVGSHVIGPNGKSSTASLTLRGVALASDYSTLTQGQRVQDPYARGQYNAILRTSALDPSVSFAPSQYAKITLDNVVSYPLSRDRSTIANSPFAGQFARLEGLPANAQVTLSKVKLFDGHFAPVSTAGDDALDAPLVTVHYGPAYWHIFDPSNNGRVTCPDPDRQCGQASKVTVDSCYFGAVPSTALAVLHAAQTVLTNNLFDKCFLGNAHETGATRPLSTGFACTYVKPCWLAQAAQLTVKTNQWNSQAPTVAAARRITAANGGYDAYYAALYIDLGASVSVDPAQAQRATINSILPPLLGAGISGNGALAFEVLVRADDFAEANFLDASDTTLPSSFDRRLFARALSAKSFDSRYRQSTVNDVMLMHGDGSVQQNPLQTKPYYCTGSCPTVDASTASLATLLYVFGGVVLFAIMWLACCGGARMLISMARPRSSLATMFAQPLHADEERREQMNEALRTKIDERMQEAKRDIQRAQELGAFRDEGSTMAMIGANPRAPCAALPSAIIRSRATQQLLLVEAATKAAAPVPQPASPTVGIVPRTRKR